MIRPNERHTMSIEKNVHVETPTGSYDITVNVEEEWHPMEAAIIAYEDFIRNAKFTVDGVTYDTADVRSPIGFYDEVK